MAFSNLLNFTTAQLRHDCPFFSEPPQVPVFCDFYFKEKNEDNNISHVNYERINLSPQQSNSRPYTRWMYFLADKKERQHTQVNIQTLH